MKIHQILELPETAQIDESVTPEMFEAAAAVARSMLTKYAKAGVPGGGVDDPDIQQWIKNHGKTEREGDSRLFKLSIISELKKQWKL